MEDARELLQSYGLTDEDIEYLESVIEQLNENGAEVTLADFARVIGEATSRALILSLLGRHLR